MFACFGTIPYHVSVLEIACLYAIFHHFPCLDRVAFDAFGSVIGIRAGEYVFRLPHFHLMATDVSVAEVHSCWCKSIVQCVCHFIVLCMLGYMSVTLCMPSHLHCVWGRS